MKIALYIEDGLEQIVLTPDSKTEANILGKLHDGSRELKIIRGTFYGCQGGWTRWKQRPNRSSMFGTYDDDQDESTMIVLRPAEGTPTRSAETTGSVGEADGGPVVEDYPPGDPQ